MKVLTYLTFLSVSLNFGIAAESENPYDKDQTHEEELVEFIHGLHIYLETTQVSSKREKDGLLFIESTKRYPSITKQKLSPADELNGVEFRGRIDSPPTSFRTCYVADSPDRGNYLMLISLFALALLALAYVIHNSREARTRWSDETQAASCRIYYRYSLSRFLTQFLGVVLLPFAVYWFIGGLFEQEFFGMRFCSHVHLRR